MGILDRVTSRRGALPRRTLVYGVHGVGKSTFAASAPRPIILQLEDGLVGIDAPATPLLTSYEEVVAALQELHEREHEYSTVVLDTLDWLEPLVWQHACRRRGWSHIEEPGYGRGYVAAQTAWRDILAWLDTLRHDRDMACVLVAHAKVERFEDPASEGYDRYAPKLQKQAAALVTEWCDDVLFATYKKHVRTVEAKAGKRTRAIGDGERVLYTTERPSHMAKNRAALPDELPLDFTVYMQQVYGHHAKED